MPLDPQLKTLLETFTALQLPAYSTLTPEAARAQVEEYRLKIGPLAPARTEDRRIPGPAGEIPVRIYTPDGSAPYPLLVYFHGGGWVIGTLDSYDNTCRLLANQARCIVVSVDYRLAPEHTFPAAADDAYAATVWAAAHAQEFEADAARVAVAGDSAGGNLSAVVSLMARDRGGPPLAYQALVYPVTDFDFGTASYRDNATGYLLTTDTMRWFWGHYLAQPADGEDPYASPLRAPDLRGLPPALVITAEFDPLRDEGEAYAARLREAGVFVTCTRYDGMTHGFFNMSPMLPRASDAIAEVSARLREAFSAVPAQG